MAVCLISKDYSTNYCVFSYDTWSVDGDMLPNLNSPGKGVLNTVKSCSQGSLARGTDSTNRILTGGNLWIPYQASSGSDSSGSGGGGSSGSGGDSGSSDDGFIEL